MRDYRPTAPALGCPRARLQRTGLLGAVWLAPARLGGPLAPRSAPCTLNAHGRGRVACRPPRTRRGRRRAPCSMHAAAPPRGGC
eukprot:6744884-Prymnesium_polylepis.1